ncbi:hypothetical protein T492DRAFT_876900, partial [Pavlovales sp. CCMP2436]
RELGFTVTLEDLKQTGFNYFQEAIELSGSIDFEALWESIAIEIIPLAAGSDFTWDERFDQLVVYASRHAGSYNVSDHDRGLGTWLMNQRQGRRKQTCITKEHIEKLNALPSFEWDVREAAWRRMVEQLLEYAGQHAGSCDVPKGWPEKQQLAKWVSLQRQEARTLNEGKKAKIDHERIAELDDIGNANGEELAGGRPPLDKYVRIDITRARIEKLDTLCGSGWRALNTPDALFEKELTAVHDYLTQHGTIDVSLIGLAGAALEKAEGVRNFLVRIRAHKRKFDKVSESPGLTSRAHAGIPKSLEQIQAIEARLSKPDRPFQWKPDEATWQANYEKLKTFSAANPGLGCSVKKDHPLYRVRR